MNAETLARLTREAEAPEGVAVRVSGPEMKRLLEERAALLVALADALEPWCDICRTDGEDVYPQTRCESGCEARQQSWFAALARAGAP